jgi:hypothetical protein
MIERDRRAPFEEFIPRKLQGVVRDHILRTLRHFGNTKDVAAREQGISVDELTRLAGEG